MQSGRQGPHQSLQQREFNIKNVLPRNDTCQWNKGRRLVPSKIRGLEEGPHRARTWTPEMKMLPCSYQYLRGGTIKPILEVLKRLELTAATRGKCCPVAKVYNNDKNTQGQEAVLLLSSTLPLPLAPPSGKTESVQFISVPQSCPTICDPMKYWAGRSTSWNQDCREKYQ